METRRVAMIAVFAIPIVAAVAFALRPRRSPTTPDLPRLADGRVEGCLACHGDYRGLGAPHAIEKVGCSGCHMGDPRATEANDAHEGIELLSGDLSTVFGTCGRGECHVTQAARVIRSVMARAPGIVSVDRFAFGVSDSPDGRPTGFVDLDPAGPPRSHAESHVRKLCGSCHLAARKDHPGDDGFFARGGGCAACHLGPPDSLGSQGTGPLHRDVSAVVPLERCEGCHARSGRIALSYRGIVELEPTDPRVTSRLPDGRPAGKAPPDVHATAGLTCVDCHVERELMGDGEDHRHAHEALEIRCADCHAADRGSACPEGSADCAPGTVRPASRPDPDEDAARAANVLRASWKRRGMPALPDGPPLRTSRGTELWRTSAKDRSMALATDGKRVAIQQAEDRAYHRLAGHERLSCQACHSQWTPRCTECHTRLDPQGEDVDHLSGVATKGRWIERAGGNGFGPPLLAVGPRGTIDPFTFGMTLTIEGAGPVIDRALWAPLEPHTTGPSRTCASCHNPASIDDVYPSKGTTTRGAARLFDDRERAAITRVGRCIGCHPTYEDRIYEGFATSVRRLRERTAGSCRGDPNEK